MYDMRKLTGIVIDAGHGGSDPGAVSGTSLEKDYTLLISKYIYDRSRKRCLFGTLNKPEFTVKNGKWIDHGYGQKTIDAGRTLTLTVTGKVVGGTNVKKHFRKYFEFPMNTNGDIG